MTAARFRESVRYWRTPLLPGADLVTARYRDHEFAPHWHDAYTIPVIETGAERYDSRGSGYIADTGSVPVINPGDVHTGSRADDNGWSYRVGYVPVDFIRDLARAIAGTPQDAPWFRAGVIHDPDLARRLVVAYRAMEAGDDPLAAETAMLDAFSTLLARHSGTRPRPQPLAAAEPRIEAMRERLAADLGETVTLAEVAHAAGLSPFHATRLFTRATGMPPHAWRNQLRLQRSLASLRAGAAVTDIAAASGFTDQSHFTRHFKRMFGVPPGRWQRA
ncbi:AraC family transcriptional regulator [Burkholderia alba]|uniref:AraC family transcriptional regulator n=1 Tax=Burkholderia alba TaxID=2683677 RepID=UPI002B05AD2C|nr:AraC family transcriptional regulator [Burkholderia alba]